MSRRTVLPLLPPPAERPTAPRSARHARRSATAVLLAAAMAAVGAVAQASVATAAPTSLSDGRPATASSSENPGWLGAAMAFDGDPTTRWASQWTDDEWIQVDLGQVSSIDHVVLRWEAAYASAFEIQVSSDGASWSTAETVTGGTGGTQTVDVDAVGRFVRMAGTERATGYGYSLWEVEVVGEPGAGDGGGGDGGGEPGADCASGPADGAVRITGGQGAWCLLVDGEPYYVKGMTWGPAVSTFEHYAPQLEAMGVNTIRTWGTDASSRALLDAAAAHDIRVMAGFWLAPGGGPGSGGCPNYLTDVDYKSAVMNDITTWVTEYRDHPGVLMWNVGNESLLGLQNCYSGAELENQRNAYASFVNEAAQAIHRIDPDHPVTSTDAWTGAWPYLERNAPDLDLYGLNSYGAICDTEQAWVEGGYDKPYIITEGGPAGEWEVADDVNGVPDQGTDLENAAGYTEAWECITAHEGVALGATLFHFGNEGDFGGIWFNVLPGDNRRLSFYAVAEAYGGPAAAPGVNRPPVFTAMEVPQQTEVVAGSTFTVSTAVSDPDGDPLTYAVLLNSTYVNGSWGLAETPFTRSGTTFRVQAPQTLGVWKVYVFAEDGQGNVGVETRSFRVVPPPVSGTNIALGRPATASSFDPWNGNWTPGQATDGDYSTRWSSAWSDAEWLQVDLGSVRAFDQVQLVWESAFARAYDLQVSSDGTTWTTVRAVRDGDGGVDTIEASGLARYVRVLGVERGTPYGYSLYELAVYDS